MSYKDIIPEDELGNYEIVNDWEQFSITHDSAEFDVFKYSKKIFLNNVFLNTDYVEYISFEECYFEKSIIFQDSVFHKSFYFSNCIVEDRMQFKGNPIFKKSIHVWGEEGIRRIEFEGGEFNECYLGLGSTDYISISAGNFKNLDISVHKQLLYFDLNANSVVGNIFINGESTVVYSIKINGIANLLSLVIDGILIGALRIENYRNDNKLRISNINALDDKSSINIANSYLGKAEFDSLNLSKFYKVVFDKTHLVDSVFTNIIWGNRVNKALTNELTFKTSDVENIHFRNRETFRQLKYVMSKQGDIVNEQKFHSIEMLAHYNMLSWVNSFWTKLIIKLSFITSDFGQSIWRPLLFLFLFHSILFVCLVSAGIFPDFKPSFKEFSILAFGEGINYFFYLVNPIRPFDKVLFHGGWIIIDLLMRISSSYMIYNLVRATRRFIK